MTRSALVLGLLGLLTVTASEGCACTSQANAGVVLSVRDVEGRPAVRGAVVTAREGSFVDRLYPAGDSDLTVSGLYERPGTYQVKVVKKGFRPWSEKVEVGTTRICDHVRTRRIDVVLEPAQ